MALKYLTTVEAAEVLGISANTLRTLIADPGGPPVTDIGRNGRPRLRFNESALREWMESRERPVASAS